MPKSQNKLLILVIKLKFRVKTSALNLQWPKWEDRSSVWCGGQWSSFPGLAAAVLGPGQLLERTISARSGLASIAVDCDADSNYIPGQQ